MERGNVRDNLKGWHMKHLQILVLEGATQSLTGEITHHDLTESVTAEVSNNSKNHHIRTLFL